MPRLIININLGELDALVNMALRDLRKPQDQARFLLRQKLHEEGLLEGLPSTHRANPKPPEQTKEVVSNG
jgi:hypothetical protein